MLFGVIMEEKKQEIVVMVIIVVRRVAHYSTSQGCISKSISDHRVTCHLAAAQ